MPLSLALMLLASSYRVQVFWFESGFRHEVTSGEQNTWLEVHDPGFDARGDFERDYDVRVSAVADVPFEADGWATVTRQPPGTRTVQVTVDFRTDPDTVFAGCHLFLLDTEGAVYGGPSHQDPLRQGDPCTPEGQPGPQPAIYADQPPPTALPGEERPAEWSVEHRFLVPDDAVLSQLRVGFEHPDYVSLRLAE